MANRANNQKNLHDLGNMASKTLGGLMDMVEAAKKDLTPEQRKEVDKEIANIDIGGAMANLKKANGKMDSFYNQYKK